MSELGERPRGADREGADAGSADAGSTDAGSTDGRSANGQDLGEETVVVARPVGDETVVVARPAAEETVADRAIDDLTAPSGATVVVPRARPAGRPVDESGLGEETVVRPRPGGRSVPPAIGPVPAAPGATPVHPAVEPDVPFVLHEVYAPRTIPPAARGDEGPDAVLRRIGPPPTAPAIAIAPRKELASLARRTRRGRVVTLAVYAAVIVCSAVGLWAIATLALSG